MRLTIDTQLDYLHMVLIEEGHNVLRFHVHGDRARAESFAEHAKARFERCLEELNQASWEEHGRIFTE